MTLAFFNANALRLVVENQKKRIIGVNGFFYTIIVGVKDKVFFFFFFLRNKIGKDKIITKT